MWLGVVLMVWGTSVGMAAFWFTLVLNGGAMSILAL